MINLNDVLLAMSNIPVGDPIVEIWGRGLQGSGYTVMEYTGELPITFNANGEALIDYRIYGNTEQTGTPTPENPITPIGCGERTENLIDESKVALNRRINNNGNTSASDVSNLTDYIDISASSFMISGVRTTNILSYNTRSICLYDSNKNFIVGVSYDPDVLLTPVYIPITSADVKYVRFAFDKAFENGIVLTKGSTAPSSYIPYGYKLPILSNSTITNIYLGKVATTRRIKKLVLTGNENFYVPSISLRVPLGFTISCIGNYVLGEIVTHFKVDSSSETNPASKDMYTARLDSNGNITWFFVPLNFFSGELNVDTCKAEFKSFLAAQYAAGTPVTVWYVLAEPETAVVNEPLMKIGDYADTVSMEQAGVSIPTNNGSTVIDYDGTPKPSQMYIKYLEVKND